MKVLSQHHLFIKAAALLGLACLFVLLGWLPLVTAVLILGFAVAVYGYAISSPQYVHQLVWLTAFLLGIVAATYRPAGFHYPLVADAPSLYTGGEPFALRVNVAKALAGWTLVVLLAWPSASGQPPWIRTQAYQWGLVFVVTATIILFAQTILGLAWVPKLPEVTLTFMLVNVAITCVAEEAFFRLLLQRHLALLFERGALQLCIPVVVASLLFALTHRLAVDALFVVYVVAGLGYALVYALTQRFIAAVAVHAGVNITHFLLLPYPLPASV